MDQQPGYEFMPRTEADMAVDMTVRLRSQQQHLQQQHQHGPDLNFSIQQQPMQHQHHQQQVPLHPSMMVTSMQHFLHQPMMLSDQKLFAYLDRTPDNNINMDRREDPDLFSPLHTEIPSSHHDGTTAVSSNSIVPVTTHQEMITVTNSQHTNLDHEVADSQNSEPLINRQNRAQIDQTNSLMSDRDSQGSQSGVVAAVSMPGSDTCHKTLKCDDCGQCFVHVCKTQNGDTQNDKPHKCIYCGKSFNSASHLVIHIRTHTGEKPYSCLECQKSFVSAKKLAKHRKSKHVKQESDNIEDDNDVKPQVPAVENDQSSSDITHSCIDCNESFPTMNKLTRHRRKHQPDNSKALNCEFCGKHFSKVSNLSRHRRIHTGLKPHKCETCGKGFIEAKELIIHTRNHTGERPFKCDECGNLFISLSSLTAHKRRHTGEKPHKCDQCGKCFFTSTYLKYHLKLHSGNRSFDDSYVCDECGKFFSTSSNLKAHKKFHTGEKPHQCKQCGKGFTKAGDLRVHYRIHTGEKPYQCSDCGKCFTTASNFSTHRRIHTKSVTSY